MSSMAADRTPTAGGPGLVVREVDPTTDPRWDAFVARHPRAVPFHRAAWLQVLAQEYDQPQVDLVCEDDSGRVVGVLPLVLTRGLPFGIGGHRASARLCSLPRTSVAGPLTDTATVAAALLGAAVERAAERGVVLQVKPVVADLDGLVPGITGVPWRNTYVLDLPEDPDAECFGTHHRHRRLHHLVSKAEREGVRVRTGDRSDLDPWYRLYLEGMRLHAQPARPRRLFTAVLDACERDRLGRFSVAEIGHGAARRLVGGVFCLETSPTAYYAFTGLDRQAATLHPIDALLWDAIHRAHADGMRRFDLGEVQAEHHALATFKLKWGTHPELVHRYYWPAVRPDTVADDGPPTRIARMSHSAWRRLPLGVTEVAGRIAHHYL